MEKNFRRQVVIDKQGNNRDRLNIISFNTRRKLGYSEIRKKLKNALADRREEVEFVPKVTFKFLNYKKNIDMPDVRAYIYESKKCHSEQINVNANSHIVQISISNIEKRGWHNGEANFPAKVYIDPQMDDKCVFWLLEDIMLDITMFYLYSLDLYITNNNDRREFSKTKVEFVKDHDLHSFIGELDNPEYVALASFFRDQKNGTFEWNKYLDHWESLIKNLKLRNRSELPYITDHPKYGQISPNKLKELFDKNDAGVYFLVRTETKPKEEEESIYKEILNRFGMMEWKTGKILIVPTNQRYTWERLSPYISMFLFRLEK